MDPYVKRNLARVRRHRNFPENTCSAARHVELIAGFLGRGKRYAMIEEEPEVVAASMLSVVGSLYKARSEIARLKSKRG